MKKIIYIILCCTALLTVGCQSNDTADAANYGYVQFKVVKSSSLEQASRVSDILDNLADADKITVVMQHDGSTITQTLPLSSYDDESAAWGLQSEKLRLLVGKYNIIGYQLYNDNNIEEALLSGGSAGEFIVEKGGLTTKRIGVNAVERGMVSFRLDKDFTTRSGEGEYRFSTIKSVDITVKNNTTKQSTTYSKLMVRHVNDFAEGSADEELYGDHTTHYTEYALCDTVVWMEAGDYIVTEYTTYSDTKAKKRLERATIEDKGATFEVMDNLLTKEASVPIICSTAAEHIKDYEALKEIWLALNGPEWTFHGEEYAAGTNWDFNKDIDLWGVQPGVTLNAEGRVEGLNISGFGAEGMIPEAIGQLTQLKTLYLGNHNELIGGYDYADLTKRIDPMDYNHKVLAYDGREGLSKELKDVINRDPEQRPILSSRINLKDVAFGNYTSGISGISRAVMRLTLLEQLYIANCPITDDTFFIDVEEGSPYYDEQSTWSWGDFVNLTDLEIYNCPKLDRLPRELITELPVLQSVNFALNLNISGEQLLEDWEALAKGKSGADVQILYLGFNNLRTTPEHNTLKLMKKLGLLDCTNNKIEVVHALGKDIVPTTIYFDNNRITKIETVDGYFCGLDQMETFSCSGNLLTELPDIFTAASIYTMQSVNFSSNKISSLEHGDAWRGVNVATLNLANNHFEELTPRIIGSGSIIETLMLSANGIRTIEKGALKGKNSETLTTIDLSFNRISELPYDDFSASNLPYLYGIDLSSNAFEEFPYAPLSIDRLTVMSIRQQRDDAGNRTLREWPQGLSTCPRMSAFYIGSNDLRKIDDTISPYILLFEIKDNPNISIDLSNVCPYIEMGYYELIYDSTQDIRGCDALNLDK